MGGMGVWIRLISDVVCGGFVTFGSAFGVGGRFI